SALGAYVIGLGFNSTTQHEVGYRRNNSEQEQDPKDQPELSARHVLNIWNPDVTTLRAIFHKSQIAGVSARCTLFGRSAQHPFLLCCWPLVPTAWTNGDHLQAVYYARRLNTSGVAPDIMTESSHQIDPLYGERE